MLMLMLMLMLMHNSGNPISLKVETLSPHAKENERFCVFFLNCFSDIMPREKT